MIHITVLSRFNTVIEHTRTAFLSSFEHNVSQQAARVGHLQFGQVAGRITLQSKWLSTGMWYAIMELDAILAILLSWASHLSGYPMPHDIPEVRFEQHAYFVENVCGGKECNVVGWYNDADVVYIDEQYRDIDGGFASGLVVHEFTHYLQDKSGDFKSLSCDDSIAREREAYYVQNRYIIEALARIDTIHPSHTTCNYANAGVHTHGD